MSLRVREIKLNVLDTKTRMPFRFGIVTMTATPHLFVTAEVEVDGKTAKGVSSDGLAPKWFTKNPDSTYREELEDMLSVIESAGKIAVNSGRHENIFSFWQSLYNQQKAWGDSRQIPPLLRNLGVSLVERAVICGYCKAEKITLREALSKNLFGIELGKIYKELEGYKTTDLLDFKGVRHMYVRHTVGLTDYLRVRDIPEDERMKDGLPQALEECIKEYGIARFKIKLSGDIQRDASRLECIHQIILDNGITDYAFTLDGNENYEDANDFVKLWSNLTSHESLKEMLDHLIFVEQPIKRNKALSEETRNVFLNWKEKPPIIIDESDSEIGSVVRALDCGYQGTSHKNCKGIIKGIANACYLKHMARKNPDENYILSAEDLANIGPVALLQDLAVLSLLGIPHAERNGHHYFKGLSMFPDDIQENVLKVHGDLYRKHENGFATLKIEHGKICLDSVLGSPFGFGFELDASRFTPVDKWKVYDS